MVTKNMNSIVVFSGSGLDAESGVSTFRDIKDGLWYNYEVDKVATKEGWKKDKELVLEFHNMLRKKLHKVEPNLAHNKLVELEDKYYVTHITQNVSDLLERAGASKVLHIHGELFKCKSTYNSKLEYDCRGSINIGDKCEKGSQLKPGTVLFGEYPNNILESKLAIRDADILIIIGCSFEIQYTPELVSKVKNGCKVYYIDPNPSDNVDTSNMTVVKEIASVGLNKIINEFN